VFLATAVPLGTPTPNGLAFNTAIKTNNERLASGRHRE
jgi:hypothetical protein